jgi:hypothetical protein
MLIELERDAGQRVRPQLIVVVEKSDELAVGNGQRRVGGLGDMTVGVAKNDFDALIQLLVFLQNLADVRLLRCIIGNAEFPVFVDLGAHGLDGPDEPLLRGVVGRHQDRDQGPALQFFELRTVPVEYCRRKRIVRRDPGFVGIRGRRRRLGGATNRPDQKRVPRAGFVEDLEDQLP